LRRLTQDPTLLSRVGPEALNITSATREKIVQGYISGFRTLFILNASFAAFAAVIAFTMIRHKELIREDDAARKAEARKKEEVEMRAAGKSEDGKRVATARNDSASKGETATRRAPTVNGF